MANAKTLIGPANRIRDNVRDNVGFGLKISDIGGGYVEITTKVLGTLIVVK